MRMCSVRADVVWTSEGMWGYRVRFFFLKGGDRGGPRKEEKMAGVARGACGGVGFWRVVGEVGWRGGGVPKKKTGGCVGRSPSSCAPKWSTLSSAVGLLVHQLLAEEQHVLFPQSLGPPSGTVGLLLRQPFAEGRGDIVFRSRQPIMGTLSVGCRDNCIHPQVLNRVPCGAVVDFVESGRTR